MTFSQIPYMRADLDAWKAKVEDQTRRFRAAQTFEEADALYREAELSSAEFDTMISLASIRRDIDTRDEFYDAEDTYYKQQMPAMQAAFKAWTMATLESPFRKELEESGQIIPLVFRSYEVELKSMSPEIIEDMKMAVVHFKLDRDIEFRNAAVIKTHDNGIRLLFENIIRIRDVASKLSELDVYLSLAHCAVQNRYTPPEVDMSDIIEYRILPVIGSPIVTFISSTSSGIEFRTEDRRVSSGRIIAHSVSLVADI
mgnify:CR=1 FL=1